MSINKTLKPINSESLLNTNKVSIWRKLYRKSYSSKVNRYEASASITGHKRRRKSKTMLQRRASKNHSTTCNVKAQFIIQSKPVIR